MLYIKKMSLECVFLLVSIKEEDFYDARWTFFLLFGIELLLIPCIGFFLNLET